MASDRNLLHLHPAFRDKYVLVLKEMQEWLDKHRPGMTCKMTDGYRSQEEQKRLYAQGRTAPGPRVTQRSGLLGHESNHQSSLSADTGFFKDSGKTYVPEPGKEVWDYYAHLGRAHGLDAGHDWESPDSPHLEWKEKDAKAYSAARLWQISQGLR